MSINMRYILVVILSLLLSFCQPVAASTPTWIVEQSRGQLDEIAAAQVIEAVIANANLNGINPDTVFKVISVESRYKPRSVSNKGARGLMQVMPVYHKSRYIGENIHDIDTNIRVGVEILSEYIYSNYCGGNEDCGIRRYYGDLRSNRYLNLVRGVKLPDKSEVIVDIAQVSCKRYNLADRGFSLVGEECNNS
mgnify:CR=1 FL=1